LLEEEIAEIFGSQGEVQGIVTTGGQQIDCEMVLIAIGVDPLSIMFKAVASAVVVVYAWMQKCAPVPLIFMLREISSKPLIH